MVSTDTRDVMARGDARGPDHLPGLAGRAGPLGSVAALNLGIRFCVELATFASLSYWGASINTSAALRTILAVSVPLVAMVAWSRLLAPRAPGRLSGPAALIVELSIFAIATWALVSSGMGLVGMIYASLAVINSFLTRAFGQYAPAVGTPAEGDRP